MISSFCFKPSTPFLRGKLGRTIVWVIIISLIAINITWCKNYYRRLECKSRNSRNSWSNWQIWLKSTEWSRTKAHRVLPRERTGYSKHPLPTTQEKTLHMDITRWSTLKSDWLYSLQPKIEKLYTVSKNNTGTWLWLRSWTPYCQIQLKLKKVGKTTRPFRYGLNQIP